MRRSICLILCLFIFVMQLITPVFASTTTEIQPRYTYIAGISADISVSALTGIATCSGRIQVKYLIPVTLFCDLQKRVDGQWITIKRWSATGTGATQITQSWAIPDGYTYRVRTLGYVYDTSNNLVETGNVSKEYSYY